ncbi:hypothetical protein OROHE_023445 [Orobanche hederae]
MRFIAPMIFQLPVVLLGDFGTSVCLIRPSLGRSGDVFNRSMVIYFLTNDLLDRKACAF